MISNDELARLVDIAKSLGVDVKRTRHDMSEGRCIIEAVAINGTEYDPITAGEKLRALMPAAPNGEAVTLEWHTATVRDRALWWLKAPAAVLAAIGGAPCHASRPGQIGLVSRDGRSWQGNAELTPYDSHKTPAGREMNTRMRLQEMVSRHLEGLGFAGVIFADAGQ